MVVFLAESTLTPRVSFTAVKISPPDLSQPKFASAPDAKFGPAPADGVLPENFFSSTNLPTYVKIKGQWKTPREPRMDAGLLLDDKGELWAREGRRVRKGQLVALGTAEDGTEGILVHSAPFFGEGEGKFEFMASEVSREKPIDYARMASILVQERESGYPIWITGPALVHSRARSDMSWFIANGFVRALLAGNAVAVHDIEASIYGTTLGMTRTGEIAQGGHGLHMRAINKVRAAGGLKQMVESGQLRSGIMKSAIDHGVDMVLAGSIRDDGPLPDVITDMVEAQQRMRENLGGVRMALMLSTMLHSIATGNMLPAGVRTVCVDINPAVVTKLADRGTWQSIGLVTDVESFLRELALVIETGAHGKGQKQARPRS